MSGCWPTPAQEQLLLACFAAEPTALRALGALSSSPPADGPDLAVSALLPSLYRRWPAAESELVRAGQKVYLTLWRENRERMRSLAELVAEFEKLGIRCLVLKGAALALRHYADLGLRGMRDFDLLVSESDLKPAIARLRDMGYTAERGYAADAIVRQARAGHAWQFFRNGQSCDLHWRPLARCYSPEVTRLFWDSVETTPLGAGALTVLSPTDQLFHVCAHGLQWDWSPPIRWIADAMTVMRDPIDWDRVVRLAEESCMRVRLASALHYLRLRFEAPVPAGVVEHLDHGGPRWERREHRLLLKPCPLGGLDSVAWHAYNFRRLRPFDVGWRKSPLWIGFPQYLEVFLGARGLRDFFRKLWPELKIRLNEQKH